MRRAPRERQVAYVFIRVLLARISQRRAKVEDTWTQDLSRFQAELEEGKPLTLM